jgi:two-component system, NarL family, nitrate/nitrite response regulator NarL
MVQAKIERDLILSTQQNLISVLIADDHKLLTETVELYLRSDGGFNPARAETLDEALAMIAKNGSYDVVLLDLDMPGMGGLTGLERAIAANAPGRVVLFSGQAHRDAAMRAMDMGAAGFMPKTLSPKSLATAIRFVAEGEFYVPSAFSMGRERPEARPDKARLTPREYEVLKCICAGNTNRDIADQLRLTEVTVKMHVRSVCAKLDAGNRTQAAITALTTGMV